MRAIVALSGGFERRLLKLLFAVIFCGGAAFARQNDLGRTPFFEGEALPSPPQQNAPWSHGADAFSKAAATLFDQGLADPRGLEYQEIEIVVGNPWNGGGNAVKTHGWVLPKNSDDNRFAIAWNGLIYPVLRVGALVDLHLDWAFDPKTELAQDKLFESDASESFSVSLKSRTALKLALLLRLGETEIIERNFNLAKFQSDADPYLDLARDWAWRAFERAVCAHERGDDRLALADARMLTRIKPLIEEEVKRRDLQPDPDNSRARYAERTSPYLPFLAQLPALLSDCERRVADRKKSSLSANDIAPLIDDLQNVDARQWGQPGGVSLALDPRIQALVKRGDAAVEPLLNAMEQDIRLTRSVSFGRDFFRERHLITVSEAAEAALVDLLRVHFDAFNENGKPLSSAAQYRAYWNKMRDLPPIERFYVILKDDQAGTKQWLQAAAYIVQPVDVESHGGWTTVPNRKPNQKIELRGESLRDGRTPSVAQLLDRRSDQIAAIRTNSTMDHFLYLDAGQMALYLAAWDKTAAIPTLKKRLLRAWNIGAQAGDILAFNGNPVEHFGSMIAKMTIARAECGDGAAFDEYAAWIQRVELKGVAFASEELQKPLIYGAERPSVKKAIEYLFNDHKSPWSDVLAEGNGFWLIKFWQTPLPQTEGFRHQALRALTNKNPVGYITFNAREDWDSRGEALIVLKGLQIGFGGSDNDPDTPSPNEKRFFRVCDVYAYFYSQYQQGPKFQLFWSEERRDAGVQACLKWLEPAVIPAGSTAIPKFNTQR